MTYHIHTLKNGLRVLLVPVEGAKTATVMVMSGTGSRYESARENGLAHFLEHMFFKGTAKRPTARVISEELDGIGSEYNAFTAKERTAYYAKVSERYLDTALDVISDIFLHSALPPREITKERGAIIQEIDMYEDMPMRTIDNVFDALIFGSDHPLGRTTLGPKENIRAFKRKDFSNYLRRNYTPLNTVVCVAGSFEEERVLAKIKKDFGTLPHGNPPDCITFSSEQGEPRVAVKHKKTDQTQLMLGVPAYPYQHTDEYALIVLASVLGGGMSSRLFSEVREKRGLAYFVRAATERYPDTGYLYAQAGVEHAKLEKTIATILGEFRKLVRTPIGAAELKKVKAHIKGITTLELEGTDSLAENYTTSLVNLDRVRPLEELMEGIDAVSAADVQRVAKDVFKASKLNLAVIGPHADKEKLRALLRL
jgi:predicted Zn-dependent peptidase